MSNTGRRGYDNNRRSRGRGQYRGRGTSRGAAAAPRLELELLSAPSRNDGTHAGDQPSLLDLKTQEDYRKMIQGKIDSYLEKFPLDKSLETPTTKQKEMANNILIFFRKLREGITASSRSDDFAIEVYETSACWSVVFRDSAQATSVFSHLPELAKKRMSHSKTETQSSIKQQSKDDTILFLRLLHTLRTHLPSQTEFYSAVRALPQNVKEKPEVLLLQSMASTIRSSNYAALAKLTDFKSNEVLRRISDPEVDALKSRAVIHLVQSLQDAVREQIWAVLRASYREVSSKPEVRVWLARSLQFSEGDAQSVTTEESRLSVWMGQKAQAAEVIVKEGANGWQFRKG
ncbi:hypothetical protein FRC03_011097 [Tulasnella sp. 419]|nr:hypothetical protein FRC03_011097 [Tulasnella sp. 419]